MLRSPDRAASPDRRSPSGYAATRKCFSFNRSRSGVARPDSSKGVVWVADRITPVEDSGRATPTETLPATASHDCRRWLRLRVDGCWFRRKRRSTVESGGRVGRPFHNGSSNLRSPARPVHDTIPAMHEHGCRRLVGMLDESLIQSLRRRFPNHQRKFARSFRALGGREGRSRCNNTMGAVIAALVK
jgi:hypothetical protein